MNVLEVKNLHAHIGPFHIVQGLTFNVPLNESVALLGRNGVGKTTTLKSIVGMITRVTGSIRFMGREISGLPSHQRASLGIGYIPDVKRIFPNLTVEENLLMGMIKDGGDKESRLKMVYDIFPDLRRLRYHKGKELSGGQQQMLNIARGIISQRNKLLLIDELTEGMSPLLIKKIVEVLLMLKEQKISMLLAEGKLDIVRQVAERCVIISQGKIVWSGMVQYLLEDKELIRQHLGVTV